MILPHVMPGTWQPGGGFKVPRFLIYLSMLFTKDCVHNASYTLSFHLGSHNILGSNLQLAFRILARCSLIGWLRRKRAGLDHVVILTSLSLSFPRNNICISLIVSNFFFASVYQNNGIFLLCLSLCNIKTKLYKQSKMWRFFLKKSLYQLLSGSYLSRV